MQRTINRFKLIPLLCLTFLFLSCEELDEFTSFDIDYSTDFTIPNTNGAQLPIAISSPTIPSDLESKVGKNGIALSAIESVSVKEVALTIIDSSDVDFAFIDDITMSITDGENREEVIATRSNVPSDIGKVLELETTNADIFYYLKEESFRIKVALNLNDGTTQSIESKVDLVFNIDVL